MRLINKLYILMIGALLFTTFNSCSDDSNDTWDAEGLTMLDKNKSFSFMTFNMGDYDNASAEELAAFMQKYDPALAVVKNLSYNYNAGQESDIVTEVVYNNSFKHKQKRVGIFSATSNVGGNMQGVGFFSKEPFTGTKKVLLDNVLTLHIMNHILAIGDTVSVTTCEFVKDDETLMKQQATALNKYLASNKGYVVVGATVYEDEDSNTLTTLKEQFNLLCTVGKHKEDIECFEYILTPKNQDWGVKFASVIEDESLSKYKGLFYRIGLIR